MKIVISGGSGFLGQALTRFFLNIGYEVTIISRTPVTLPVKQYNWHQKGEILAALNGADALINLAGKSVDCRYNERNKSEILHSRTNTTAQLGLWLSELEEPPKAWLNASTATIYRHAQDRPMTEENGEIGTDFSMDVAKAWEATFFKFQLGKTRQVALRTSIVMGNSGGAFLPLMRLVKMGLGGKMGSGRQMVSWIHIDDFCRAVQWILAHEDIEGSVNITAPNPVSNSQQMRALRNVLRMPFGLPTPEILLKFGAIVIGTETELVLKSRWVLPEKLITHGFTFQYSEINAAFEDLVDF